MRQQVAEALSRVREFRSQLCVLAGDVFVISRRGSSRRRLTSESPATIKARACDERGRLASHSTSGTNSGSRVSRKLVNFRTLTWQSSQGESKDGSDGPPTF